MPKPFRKRPRGSVISLLVPLFLTVLLAASVPASGQPAASTGDEQGFSIQGEGPDRVPDLDAREGKLTPTAEQTARAPELGATAVRWNAFGTPHLLLKHGGYLSGPADGAAVDVARAFVRDNRVLFRLSAAAVDALDVLRDTPLYDSPDLVPVLRDGAKPANPDVAHVVQFRQTFGDLTAGWDGLLTIGVQRDGRIAVVSSSLTGDSEVTGAHRLDAAAAIKAAAVDVELDLGSLSAVPSEDDWSTFDAALSHDVQRARLTAMPTPRDGVRKAWEVTLLKAGHDDHEDDGRPAAFISFVDAETGKVLLRSNRVDHFAQGDGDDEADPIVPMPRWRVFPANPPFADADDPSADTRQLWCWISDADACDEEQNNSSSRVPWDVTPPSVPMFTTDGNNASTAISELSFLTPDTVVQRPVSPTRNYDFAWNNTWMRSECDPTMFDRPGGADDDAATTNLFVMHNRMHDWSYNLGFTELTSNLQRSNFGNTGPQRENDPEIGNSQAGRRTFNGRDNANQITLQDGIPGITNQYLWQPLAGAFYGTCTDGAYDMAIVAHEYGHAISNRMIAGPDTGTGASQGQTESWSDLIFADYFRGFGISAGEDANPFALAPYVTGNKERGIRNYGMNESPLNYSNLAYDGNGATSPHADGEIWSATNFDIAEALNAKYDGEFPSDDAGLQLRCARGELPADECPGNRRLAQLMFDGFLNNPSGSTMVDSRDAMLAADMLRFDGANQEEMWDTFARRGLGATAESTGPDDHDPIPGWSSPVADDEAAVRFEAADAGEGVADKLTVYTGRYQARMSPTADTDPSTDVADTVEFVPGTYEFIAQAEGFGAFRFTQTFDAGEERVVRVPMRRNLASVHNGATAGGDGVNLDKLIDDTEATNWASLESAGTASAGRGEGEQVRGRQVTVELGDEPVDVAEVQVSAALRPAMPDDEADSEGQSRFSALRSFDILACDATVDGNTCDEDEAEFRVVYRSPDDAFPGVRPRPTAPDLTLRAFEVRPTTATHIRLRVRHSQCTGGPDYTGEANPVNDPVFSNPDCASEAQTPDRAVLSPPTEQVRAAEFQVFGRPAPEVGAADCQRNRAGKCKGQR
ncbi:MAG: peptidase M36 [Actinophytocola sp.]|nr:peptidase M36 [Actinophytocola sp.]